jgi:FkbM family methyltransferase
MSRSKLRQAAVRALHRRGIYRIGSEPFGAIDKDLLLRRYGIDLVFDIGANVGLYAKHLRYLGYTGRIVSLEPGSDAFKVLAASAADDPLWEVHQLAAGEVEGEASFGISSQSVSSSFLATTERFQAEHPGTVEKSRERVHVCRLDSFVESIETDARVWVKLDVEGFELAAIVGATELLARTTALEVELATERLYEDEPLFFEVAPAIYDLGFRLIAVAPGFVAPSGRTLRFDGLFVRS